MVPNEEVEHEGSPESEGEAEDNLVQAVGTKDESGDWNNWDPDEKNQNPQEVGSVWMFGWLCVSFKSFAVEDIQEKNDSKHAGSDRMAAGVAETRWTSSD